MTFCGKIFSTNVAYFFKVFYHMLLPGPKLSEANVPSTSQVHVAVLVLLLIVGL
jgi:hypothetical protein